MVGIRGSPELLQHHIGVCLFLCDAVLFGACKDLTVGTVKDAEFLFLGFEKTVKCELFDVLCAGRSRAVGYPVGLLCVNEAGQTVSVAGFGYLTIAQNRAVFACTTDTTVHH